MSFLPKSGYKGVCKSCIMPINPYEEENHTYDIKVIVVDKNFEYDKEKIDGEVVTRINMYDGTIDKTIVIVKGYITKTVTYNSSKIIEYDIHRIFICGCCGTVIAIGDDSCGKVSKSKDDVIPILVIKLTGYHYQGVPQKKLFKVLND